MEPTKTPVRQPINDIRRPLGRVEARGVSAVDRVAPVPQPAPSEPVPAPPPEQASTDQPPVEASEQAPEAPATPPKISGPRKPVLLIMCSLLVAGGLSTVAVMQYMRTNKSEEPTVVTPAITDTSANADESSDSDTSEEPAEPDVNQGTDADSEEPVSDDETPEPGTLPEDPNTPTSSGDALPADDPGATQSSQQPQSQ